MKSCTIFGLLRMMGKPTLGTWGLGWEVWCDGMEVSQFRQQVGGIDCNPVAVELTYGLERPPCTFRVSKTFMIWNGMAEASNMETSISARKEFSAHNFEHANTDMLTREFEDAEKECQLLLGAHLALQLMINASKRHTGSTCWMRAATADRTLPTLRARALARLPRCGDLPRGG